jgi:alpha-galactosidase
VHGVVAPDRSSALYAFVQLTTSALAVPEPARLPGLDPHRRYAVRAAHPAGEPETGHRDPPPWLATGIELPGRVLGAVGLPMPVLHPEQALLLTAQAAPA